jgi:hypothetical protein
MARVQDLDAAADGDDAESTEGLGALLEDFRRSKRVKQQQLVVEARNEGRPFSAPAASPSCAAIRKRTESDKILKELQPGSACPAGTASAAHTSLTLLGSASVRNYDA